MNKFSPETSLLIILFITLIVGSFGIFIENNFPIWISTLFFILFAIFYYMYAYNYELRKRLKIKNV